MVDTSTLLRDTTPPTGATDYGPLPVSRTTRDDGPDGTNYPVPLDPQVLQSTQSARTRPVGESGLDEAGLRRTETD